MGLSSDQVDAERRARQDDLTDIGNLIALPEPQWPEEILVPGPGVDATGEAVLGWPVTAPGPLSPAPADGTQMWSWLLSADAQTLSRRVEPTRRRHGALPVAALGAALVASCFGPPADPDAAVRGSRAP